MYSCRFSSNPVNNTGFSESHLQQFATFRLDVYLMSDISEITQTVFTVGPDHPLFVRIARG